MTLMRLSACLTPRVLQVAPAAVPWTGHCRSHGLHVPECQTPKETHQNAEELTADSRGCFARAGNGQG